jgi:hypothetical protein
MARIASVLRKLAIALIVAAPYLVLMWPFLSSPTIGFPSDAGGTQFPAFFYVAESIAHGYGFPGWTVFEGGVPLYVLVNHLALFLPNHLIGYVLYSLFPFNPLFLYKIVVVLGMLMVALGWWLFLKAVCGDSFSATFGTWMILLGGTGTLVGQADQVLGTIFWTPWIALCLWKCRSNRNWVYLLPVLVGFSLQGFYPQLQVIAFLALAIVVLVSGKITAVWHTVRSLRANAFAAIVLCFLLAAAPTIATFSRMDDFVSPLRHYLGPKDISNYGDYIKMARDSDSSAPSYYFLNYLTGLARAQKQYQPEYVTDLRFVSADHLLFYVGLLGLFFAAIILFFRWFDVWPIGAMAALLACAVYGVNGPIPSWLTRWDFLAVFGFRWFRQWYHVTPFLNLCLSLLAAMGLSFSVRQLRDRLKSWQRVLFLSLCFSLLLGDLLCYSGMNVRRFYSWSVRDNWWPNGFPRRSKAEFLTLFGPDDTVTNRPSEFLRKALSMQVVFKERKQAADISDKVITDHPYYPARIGPMGSFLTEDAVEYIAKLKTNSTLNNGLQDLDAPVKQGPTNRSQRIWNPLSLQDADAYVSGLARLPRATSLALSNALLYKTPIWFSSGVPWMRQEVSEPFPKNLLLTPRGLEVHVESNPAWFIVLPCNFGNHPRCFINGRRVRAFRVNATLTGVFVPEGPYDLRVEIPRTMECCLATQWLVFAAMLLLVVRTPPNRLTDKINRLANTLDSFEKAS